MSDTRFPLFYKTAAEQGVRGAAVQYLEELASRLRDNPTQEECEAAAELLQRAAEGGSKGAAAALHLTKAHRPLMSFEQKLRIGEAIDALVNDGRMNRDRAYRKAGAQFKLSASRIRAIYTEHLKAEREAQKGWQD